MGRNWELFRNFGLEAIPIVKIRESLLKDSKLDQNYLILILSSCLIATFGLLINSAAVIIGAMIIAPLMLPLRGLSFATLEGDAKLLRSSAEAIALGTVMAVGCSLIIGLVIGLPQFGSEIWSRTQPTLIDLLIAIVAGGISGYAKIRPEMSDAIPGTAISVALMPPLCVVGLTLSQGRWEAALGASLLYLTNLIGINLACIVVYVWGGYARSNELGRNLSWGVSIALIIMLAIPLGISFWQLSNQAQVNYSINKILVTESQLNKKSIEVENLRVDWKTKPPSVLLKVKVAEPISSSEVEVVEKFLSQELKQKFSVVFDVTASQRVQSSQLKSPLINQEEN
ncbi:MAG: DUF389 domain-containing protein [Xenococcaceae cyanobacterium]